MNGYNPNVKYDEDPYTVAETLNAGMGPGALRKYFDANTPIETTQRYYAIQFINDSEFASLIDEEEVDSNLSSYITLYTFPAGFVLYGSFSDIQLASGFAVGYIKKGPKLFDN